MAGTTTIAMGVVFVLLLGEIDLSIGFVSGIAGVVVAELQTGGNWTGAARLARDRGRGARLRGDRRCSRARSSPSSACPSFIVTLAGLLALQGVIQKLIGVTGVIAIQDQTIFNVANYFLAGCLAVVLRRGRDRPLRDRHAAGVVSRRRHGILSDNLVARRREARRRQRRDHLRRLRG